MNTPLERGPKTRPLYVQVADQLKQRITSGEWQDGDTIPPEKTLCASYDVARGTIRQALKLLEDEGVLRRQRGHGTFVSQTAKATLAARAQHLAFVVPYVRDSSVSTILIGFQEKAEQAGYAVIFNHVNNDTAQQREVIQRLVRQQVRGIALYPVDSDYLDPIPNLIAEGYPIVLVDRYLKGVSTDYVMSDHFGGALRAVHYLLEQGYRRIGLVTWLSPAISMEHRALGYAQALRERGIEPEAALICQVEGYPTVALDALKAYLTSPNRPAAVFAANDQIAAALYRAAGAVGLSIPQDLAIVGFDNLDLSPHLDPPLTTIAQPFREIGRTAANILLRRIHGETSDLQQMTLAPTLVVRQSCALRQMQLHP
jgi:GntR family transcriptional regulator of arabinose operon